jgi:hypothetical protein
LAHENSDERAKAELITLLSSNGLRKIASVICEKLEIERKDDLMVLSQRDIDGLQLKDWQQTRLSECIQLVKVTMAGSLSVNDSDLSGANTASEGGDTASESGDDADSSVDAVLAKHPGNPELFQEQMKGFITDLLEVMSLGAPDGATQVFSLPLGGRTHEWSYCMLVWMRFAKDAYFDSIWRGKWQECITCPSQDKLLALLDKCLEQESTKHKWWARAEFKWLDCRKQFAAAIFVATVERRAAKLVGFFVQPRRPRPRAPRRAASRPSTSG